jgi:hypothetical protein
MPFKNARKNALASLDDTAQIRLLYVTSCGSRKAQTTASVADAYSPQYFQSVNYT